MAKKYKKKAETSAPQPFQKRLEDGRWLHRYGLTYGHKLNDLEVEMVCFVRGATPEMGALGRFRHFKNICRVLFPKLVWNAWLDAQIRSLCENQWVCWAGCGSSGKTFGAALFAFVWWLCDPLNSTVVFTSTTARMIRKRMWPNLRNLWDSCPGLPGNMVDSKTTLQSKKGDDRSAIFAQAVAEGETKKAVANIQGIHNRRVLVIIDEATDTPEAAFDACANLFAGAHEFMCLVIGNPASRFDPMGKFAEPKDGWSSVTVDTEEWETKPQLNGKPGAVLRFDAEKSPNLEGDAVRFPFLITPAQLYSAKARLGEESPLFWKFYRGFWAPDGLIKSIFTESLIVKHRGMEKHVFTGKRFFKVAGFDPAFGGGDRPVLQFGDVGELVGGGLGIQMGARVQLSIKAASSNPVHYQLAEQTKAACEEAGVPPENLAVDATGEGGGLCDIIARTWSPRIMRVEFGGKASDERVAEDDVRLASEVYARKVVELWYRCRTLLITEQLKGLDASVVVEFCNRMFDDTKARIQLQGKEEMKKAFGRSPDLADALALMVEAACRMGVVAKSSSNGVAGTQNWLATVKRYDQVHDNLYAEAD